MTNEELFLTRSASPPHSASPHLDIVPRTGEADDFLVAADRNPNTTGAKLILGIRARQPSSQTIRDEVRQRRDQGRHRPRRKPRSKAGFTTSRAAETRFLVSPTSSPTPRAEHAHVVLPRAAFAEKRG